MSKLEDLVEKELEQFIVPAYKISNTDRSLTKRDVHRIAKRIYILGINEGMKHHDDSNSK